MSRRNIGIAATVIVLIGASALGVSWFHSHDRILSEAPPKDAKVASIPENDSNIGVRVAIPYDTLSQLLDNKIPNSFSQDWTNGPDLCKEFRAFGRLIKRVCVGTRYEYTATKTAPLRISRNKDMLHATMSLDVNGKGGFRGTGAEILGLNAKNFRAGADLRSDFAVRFGDDWCPKGTISFDYTWTPNPKVEIIDRTWIDISGQVNGSMHAALKGLGDKIFSDVPCDMIKGEIAKYWHAYDVPVDAPGIGSLHIQMNPTQVTTSGIVAADDGLRVAVAMKGKTVISSTAVDMMAGPLPALGHAEDAPGQIAISLPIRVDYEVISAQIMELYGKAPIKFDIRGEEGSVRFSHVSMYPSGDEIAMAIQFEAHLPWHLFDVSGTVYAVAKPVIDASGKKIGIGDFHYSAVLDNKLWSSLAAVMEHEISQAVMSKASVDLTSKEEMIRAKLKEALTMLETKDGLAIDVADPQIKVVGIYPEDKSLAAVVTVNTSLDAKVIKLTQIK